MKEKLHEPDGNLWNFFSWYGIDAANLWKFKKQLDKFKPIKSYARIPLEEQSLSEFSSFFVHQ